MNKEFTYFEAMEEILKDKSKRFRFNDRIMYYNVDKGTIRIIFDSATESSQLYINNKWYKTKWTLVEEKKTYNVRVYDVKSNKLIESANVTMTEDEMKGYCNSKVIYETTIIGYSKASPLVKLYITRIECEEIIK